MMISGETTRAAVRIGLLFSLMAPASPANPGPFQTVTVGVEGLSDVNRNRFHEFWTPKPGISLNACAPFDYGNVEVGITVFSNTARRENVPDFTTLYISFGYGVGRRLPLKLAGHAGVHVGSVHMRFDNPQLHRFARTEQEVGLGLFGRLQLALGSRWRATASARYLTVMTHKRIHHVFFSGGVQRRFTTPSWLRDFLR